MQKSAAFVKITFQVFLNAHTHTHTHTNKHDHLTFSCQTVNQSGFVIVRSSNKIIPIKFFYYLFFKSFLAHLISVKIKNKTIFFFEKRLNN